MKMEIQLSSPEEKNSTSSTTIPPTHAHSRTEICRGTSFRASLTFLPRSKAFGVCGKKWCLNCSSHSTIKKHPPTPQQVHGIAARKPCHLLCFSSAFQGLPPHPLHLLKTSFGFTGASLPYLLKPSKVQFSF